MKKLNPYKWKIAGTLLGGLGGYLYWSQIGCLTGSCPLKSQWQTMVPYGLVMGYLLTDLIENLSQKFGPKSTSDL